MTPDGLDYRLGAVMRPAAEPLPASPPTPKIAVQIAAPPPARTDGSPWSEGLRVEDGTENGRPFDPGNPSWAEEVVFALQGISPLGRPDPATVVYDAPNFSVPRVEVAAAARFRLMFPTEPVITGVNHFLSLPYPLLLDAKTGKPVGDVAAAFYREGRFDFDRPVTGFVAVSLEAFAPADRSSAEYIFFIPEAG